jgi:hypothetical protein
MVFQMATDGQRVIEGATPNALPAPDGDKGQ